MVLLVRGGSSEALDDGLMPHVSRTDAATKKNMNTTGLQDTLDINLYGQV